MKPSNYFQERDEKNILKIREMSLILPEFCAEFFRGVEPFTTPLTRLGYANDFKTFFEFLVTNTREFYGKKIADLTLEDLDKVTVTHIEMYLEYLTVYKVGNKTFRNGEKAKSRKISSIRSLFKYFFKKEKLSKNIAELIDTPKKHESEIIRLEVDEVVKMINLAEDGGQLSKRQQAYHNHTKERDFAMVSLFLGTGIRISECVGLNVEDIDFENNAFKITRKGGNKVILYFGDEVKQALLQYMAWRDNNKEIPKTERALFVSMQNKRMTVRAVENLIKKFIFFIGFFSLQLKLFSI